MTPFPTPGDLGETLFSEEQITARVGELGAQISQDYADQSPLVIAILKGSALFVADLVRSIELPLTLDFLAVSSYGQSTESSGVVKIVKDLDQGVTGRDVLIVEDIVDSGLTLQYLLEYLGGQQPASLKSCTFLLRDQSSGGTANAAVDYVGFKIPSSAFVVGYGLDVAQKYRNLRYIAAYQGN